MLVSEFGRVLLLCSAILLISINAPAYAQEGPPNFYAAQSAFAASELNERLEFQVGMIAAGFLNAVPIKDFSLRLFKGVQRFQSENGFAADGIITPSQITRLVEVAAPMMALWGFKKVTHPTRQVTIWVPFGLGLSAVRTESGINFTDAQKRISLYFMTVPSANINRNYNNISDGLQKQGTIINYEVIKNDWYVISATSAAGIDFYLRYHQDGDNVTGFTLGWNNKNGNVSGERIAILLSASLWSDRTGAPFVDPPNTPQEVTPSEPVPTTPPPSAPAAPSPSSPVQISTGTGFFVAADGSFVTAAHVIESCSSVRIKSDNGEVQEARLSAIDRTNDLALLKVVNGPAKFASLRLGVRLGDGVEAFGFPHADLLSSSGNFTLGNITALTGIADDIRYFQVSAPVQAGNSGGPLLDQFGNVIGVVTAKMNAFKGEVPQNVNFAVKSAILTTFLNASRVPYFVGTVGAKQLDPADIAEEAKAFSGFVTCH